ncbi:glycosyltransferase [Arthrobacter sp. B10-11]|uniref:glycosyltransferase n=1 Tax=Arthrobacter sp. B10-11 TaxID=3081160 RepID=UPI0029543452|nr:glycosyltransferase [Arthrobacter sp. B10-11]MDV8146986.1 glycosyltransferase [Arthrobacter sp. B10-11]
MLGTADWNQPIATNQHYMTGELSKSFDILFIESLGLRRPELSIRDFRRAWTRLTGNTNNPAPSQRDIPSNVQVVAPLVVPLHSDPLFHINRKLLLRKEVLEWTRCDTQRVFWTYSPVTYGLEELADVAVYHCVDLLGKFPGIDNELVDRHERRLAAAGVQAAASSEVVLEHLVQQGFRDPIYWPNVADAETIIGATSALQPSRSPSAVFAGNLTSKKIDFQLLRDLMAAGVDLHLAGPVAQGGGDADALLQELVSMGAEYHGMLNLQSLSELMAGSTVGLIPYELNSYTRGVSPLKVYEYLAAGLRVVSTPVPSVIPRDGHVDVAQSRAHFVEAVRDGLALTTDDIRSERVRLARENSWSGRGNEARELVSTLLANGAATSDARG